MIYRNIAIHMKTGIMLLLLSFINVVIAPIQPASAQAERAVSVSLPSFWRDTLDIDAIVADFEAENPGTRIEVRYEGNLVIGGAGQADVDAALEAALELASTADIVYVDNSTLNTIGTRAGYFLDMTPFVNSDTELDVDDFYPAVWESFQWNEGVWALPVSTNVWMVSYVPSVFDNAGMAYPTENWTLEDYLIAAEQLTEYDAEGNVTTPGISAGFGGSDIGWLLRAALGHGFYDNSVFPEQPVVDDLALAQLLERWLELEEAGVIGSVFSESSGDIPILFGNAFIGRAGGGNFTIGEDTTDVVDVLLPGGFVGLEAQGLAISSGTTHPDVAYAFAKYLTFQAEIGNNFLGDSPARMSLQGSTTGGNNGPGGGRNAIFGDNSPLVQSIIDEQFANALPSSEMRYSEYIIEAISIMRNEGVDAIQALQDAQVMAFEALQTAETQGAATVVSIEPPAPVRTVGSGQIVLNVGVSFAGGGGITIAAGGELPNQALWDTVNERFSNNNPDIAYVDVEQSNGNVNELVEEYECFITASNLVPDSDLTGLLSIDPFLDSDFNFDRNNLIGTSLQQVQRDNATWAYPIAVSPQLLRYDATLFEQIGLPLPTAGWTADQFIDALTQLSNVIDADTAAYTPNDLSGSYILRLIAAFGGLPIDYRTDPVTISFTDPNTAEAIRQVLDLAKDGYIEYNELASNGGAGVFFFEINDGSPPPISGELQLGIDLGDQFTNTGTQLTLYPNGTQYNVLSYDITAGYISANAQNPEACYRYISEIARSPQLFNGLPADRTLLDDPTIVSQLPAGMAGLADELDRIMGDPNTIEFPLGFGGRVGANQVTNWLYAAFDDYVLNDADLETALAEAEIITNDYLACIANIDTATTNNFELFQRYNECATAVDPDSGN